MRELGLKGGYFTKEINGRTYVILRGYAGLRKVLSASRYLPTNPKVIAYGLSRAAQAAGAAVSVVITIVVLVPMEIMRYVMDEQTLDQTFGEILSGTMVSALASAVTFGIVSLTGLTTAPAWMAVGGIIVVGMAVNVALHLLGIKPAISAFISIELDRAARHLAEEEARKARGRRILGQFDHDNPGLRYGPWRGLIGPR